VTGAAAPIVGNAVINAGLSGIAAVATGANVENSMFAGLIKGAAMIGAEDFANAVLGEGTVADIAKLTGLENKQVASIFTTSVANGITADVTDQGDFFEVFEDSLISQGMGAKASNLVADNFKETLDKNPEIRAGVLTATNGIAQTATSAALQEIDVGEALERNAPGIILSSVQTYQAEADRQDALAEAKKKLVGATQQPVMVAGPPSAEILAQIQSQPTVSERAIFSKFVDDPDTGGFQQTRVQGTRNDGSVYEYDIFTFENGTVNYAAFNANGQSEFFNERPNLTNRNDLGLTMNEVAGRQITAGIDLRDFGEEGGQGRAVIGSGGFSPTTNFVGFKFIGTDGAGNQKYEIDGDGFTLFVLPNNQKVLRNDITQVELIPSFEPPAPDDPDPTPKLTLKEKTPEPEPPPAPTPEPPPEPEPVPPPEPPPVPLKPGTAADGKEGVTGKEGEKGVAGGVTGLDLQKRPTVSGQHWCIATWRADAY
jgi:hypothetical protein